MPVPQLAAAVAAALVSFGVAAPSPARRVDGRVDLLDVQDARLVLCRAAARGGGTCEDRIELGGRSYPLVPLAHVAGDVDGLRAAWSHGGDGPPLAVDGAEAVGFLAPANPPGIGDQALVFKALSVAAPVPAD